MSKHKKRLSESKFKGVNKWLKEKAGKGLWNSVEKKELKRVNDRTRVPWRKRDADDKGAWKTCSYTLHAVYSAQKETKKDCWKFSATLWFHQFATWFLPSTKARRQSPSFFFLTLATQCKASLPNSCPRLWFNMFSLDIVLLKVCFQIQIKAFLALSGISVTNVDRVTCDSF